ncbi:MAG: GTPase Era [Holosporales bacterium]
MLTKDPAQKRCGLVAVVGFPNAGKSTLVNTLVGQKVTIVSHKVQTTRNRIMGIALNGEAQIVLMDTPGILSQPKVRLEKAMVSAALGAPQESDLTVLVVDVTYGTPEGQQRILDKLQSLQKPIWVVLNKIDQMKRENLLPWARYFQDFSFVKQVFMLSALNRDGADDLLKALSQAMPEGPWLFPEDQITTAPQRMFAAEITREVLFRFLHQELPYVLYVETESWEVFRNGSIKISQVIHVLKESQKAIVIGHQGQQIKKMNMIARQELSEVMEKPVHLFLHVKVTPDWMEKSSFYTLMGLGFRSEPH